MGSGGREGLAEEQGQPSSYPKGTVLRLTCAQGHELDSPKRRVRCRKGGDWSPRPRPRCVPVKCRLPHAGEGGVFVSDLGERQCFGLVAS